MTQSRTVPDVTGLAVRARAGDTTAREELLGAHLPLIYNIIGRALAGHPDVDDLVQETMLRALRGLPDLREPERFRSWLIAIAYRQIQLHLRTCRLARARTVRDETERADPESDFAERATAEVILDAQRRDLVRATGWLDDDDRRLLGLWWQETAGELSRAELAGALHVSPKHASVRVGRMKAQLGTARAVVAALHGRPRCPELSALARHWDGVADPLWRKRLARHVRECARCEPRGRALLPPEDLLFGFAALPVPVALAAAVHGLTAVPAKTVTSALHLKLLAAATVVTAGGGGVVFAVHHSPAEPETLAAAPPAAVLTTTPRPATPTAPTTTTPPVRASAVGLGVQRADIYVAPDGSDDGDGSKERPYASVGKAVSRVRPGQTIALRGGTYRPRDGVAITTSGTAERRIVLSSYRDERPVLDASGIPDDQWAVTQDASFWTVQGLEIKDAPGHAYVCRACRANVFRRLSVHGHGRSGLMLRDPGTSGNQVLDSDFTGGGTGLSVQFGSGAGTVVRGNRFRGNSGPGLDLGAFTSAVTVEYNWAYGNGGSGFVLGGGTPPAAAPHKLRHNAAWDNGSNGFAGDGNTAALELTNNTAFRNRGTGFHLPDAAATVRSDVAVGNDRPYELGSSAAQSRNSWQQETAPFRSTDPAEADGPRTASGGLPSTAFLTTGDGSGASMGGG